MQKQFFFLFFSIDNNIQGNESLNTTSYRQEPKLSFVIKAIYTIAYGLQALHQSKCGHDLTNNTNCDAIKKFWMEKNGTEFLVSMINFYYEKIKKFTQFFTHRFLFILSNQHYLCLCGIDFKNLIIIF